VSGPLSTYAFINAKLRTRISLLFDDERIVRLERTTSMDELLEALSTTPYAAAALVYSRTGDANLCELALAEAGYATYRELGSRLSGAPGQVVAALALGFEIENLKAVLRIWFERHVRNVVNDDKEAYLPAGPWPAGTDGRDLAGIDSLDELIERIASGLDGAGKLPAADEVVASGSLYRLEIALDRIAFASLAQAIASLGGRDRAVAERLIGFEVDIENLRRIARLGSFYDLSEEEVRASLIELPSARIDTKSVSLASIDDLIGERFPEVASLLSGSRKSLLSRLDLVEAALEEAMDAEIRRVLGGYPFTVGIILAYSLLKHRETRRIMTLLNERRYGLVSREPRR
jgi:V/A-type H+/Na+-transporting ATPase subunit C